MVLQVVIIKCWGAERVQTDESQEEDVHTSDDFSFSLV